MDSHFDSDLPLDRQALSARMGAGWTPKYLFFWGHTPSAGGAVGKECLSQWYASPFEAEGVTYATAEHWMMARKALHFGDPASAEAICRTTHPGEALRLARGSSGSPTLRRG